MREFDKNLRCNIKYLKRSKIYLLYAIVIFIIMPLTKFEGKLMIENLETTKEYFSKFTFNGMIIIFSLGFLVFTIINEEFFEFFDEIIRINLKNIRMYFHSIYIVLILSTVIPYIIGQVLLGLRIHLKNGNLELRIIFMNSLVVILEIAAALFLVIGIYLLIKKDLISQILYICIIMGLLMCNSVYFALPISINIMETQGYYMTFGLPLWIGRGIILALCIGVYWVALRRFEKQFVNSYPLNSKK